MEAVEGCEKPNLEQQPISTQTTNATTEAREIQAIYSKDMEHYLHDQFSDILKTENIGSIGLPGYKLPSNSPIPVPTTKSGQEQYDVGIEVLDNQEVPLWVDLLEKPDLLAPNYNSSSSVSNPFRGTVAHTFKEHTSGIKAVGVHDFEDLFVSASKDGIVKCWRIDSPISKATYEQHKHKHVTDVTFLDRGNFIASCDGDIHVWEYEGGAQIFKLEHESQYTCIQSLGPDGRLLISGSALMTVSFNDIRIGGKPAVEWILPKYGEPKSIAVDPTRGSQVIAVGQSSGYITLIDKRSGLLLHSWRAHSGCIQQLKPYKAKQLVSSGSDHLIQVWDINQQPPSCTKPLKGMRDASLSFDILPDADELLAISGQKIISMSLDEDGAVHSIPFRLPKNPLKQNQLSTLNMLPLYQLVLIGTENGEINICS